MATPTILRHSERVRQSDDYTPLVRYAEGDAMVRVVMSYSDRQHGLPVVYQEYIARADGGTVLLYSMLWGSESDAIEQWERRERETTQT